MTEAEILNQLTEIFRETFGDDTLVLKHETTADDIEDWDSFNQINILVATEVRFRIKFQTAESGNLKDVGHLVTIIQRKLAAANR